MIHARIVARSESASGEAPFGIRAPLRVADRCGGGGELRAVLLGGEGVGVLGEGVVDVVVAGVGGGEADYPENVACRACEYANSDQDVRHSFTANAVYELPFGQGRKYLNSPGLARVLLGGWQWSSIFTARTGIPVNTTVDRSASAVPDGNSSSPQRPNLISGVSLIPAAGQVVNNWINAAAFAVPANGTFGNAGRNLVRG